MTTRKTIALTMWTFVGKVMSLLFNMLSRFILAVFSKEQVSFNFMAAVIIYSDFGDQGNKVCHWFQFFPIYLPWSDGTRCHDLGFFECLVLSQFFSLFSFTFLKRLLSSSLFSAMRVASLSYLRLLIFLLAILIPSCAWSNPAFHMKYSRYKLNKQGDNIQLWYPPFPILN